MEKKKNRLTDKIRIYALVLISLLLMGFSYVEGIASWYGGVGWASWYSVESCKREETWQKYGGKTASGEVFDDRKFIFACWHLPFGTKVEFTNLRNGKKVIAICKDRGPAKQLVKKGRIFDLSKAAFQEIEDLDKGIVKVKWRIIK